jgi:vacuolar protein sorting-associated protein VTA1
MGSAYRDRVVGVFDLHFSCATSRQYAVKLGIPLASSSPEAKTCLGQLLEDLETEKAAMDSIVGQAAFLCRKFSNKVLTRRTERIGWYRQARTPEAFMRLPAFLNLEQF